MVGFKATCSIGSVSTQDALNAFHSSGTSSKATTTGLPRLEDLTNLTVSLKVMGGSFRYNDKVLTKQGGDPIETKKEKMKRIEELRKIFEWKTCEQLGELKILKTSKTSITNKWESILKIHPVFKKPVWFDMYFDILELEMPTFDDDFIIEFKVDKKQMYRYKLTLDDIVEKIQANCGHDVIAIPSPPSVGIIYIYPNFENVELPKDINGELPTWKYYWIRDVCFNDVSNTGICGIFGIEKIFYSHENVIDYQGNNFGDLLKIDNLDFPSLTTDVIWDMVNFLGIHAAYIFLYENCPNAYQSS